MSSLNSILHAVANPTEAHKDHANKDAKVGASEVNLDARDDGSHKGLLAKKTNQEEKVAERSRLVDAGLFESNKTHEQLINHTPEHLEVAKAKPAAKEADSERLV